jgi:tetratricopeptide (TPR) repeat protein
MDLRISALQINQRMGFRFTRSRLFLTGFLLLSSIGTPVSSQWVKDPMVEKLVQKGIDELYNFEFEKASTDFNEVVRLLPDHPVGYFFRAMIQWEQIISKFDDESQDEKLYDLLDVVINMCEKRLDENRNDVTAMFFKGGAVGFRGRLRANRGKWLGAANDGIVALPLVRKAYDLEPENYDILLGIGIYNYYAAVIPSKYPIVKPVMIFFPSGDRIKGLEQLKQAAQKALYAKIEANYFLLQNYLTFEKDYAQALEIAKKLHELYPNNSIFHRSLGRCLVSTGRVGEAHQIFLDILQRFERKQTGYDTYDVREAHYYVGDYAFMAGRTDTALAHFYKCDELSRKLDKDEPSGFMSMGNLKIGMIYDLQGKRTYAMQQYKKVLALKEYEYTHRDAQKYLEQPYRRDK